jgi:cytochrome b pre-mRNA-processing protein 3
VLTWFRSRAQDRRTAIELYGAVVAQARKPAFFTGAGVRDTPEGRTSVIILLLFPVLERLGAGDAQANRLARYLCETFITDVDDSLREMGVGDMSVPKKVKRAAQALGERSLAYRRAARGSEPVPALAGEIAATMPGLEENPAGADALARLVLKVLADFGTVPLEHLAAGVAAFPDPADFAAPRHSTATEPELRDPA